MFLQLKPSPLISFWDPREKRLKCFLFILVCLLLTTIPCSIQKIKTIKLSEVPNILELNELPKLNKPFPQNSYSTM